MAGFSEQDKERVREANDIVQVFADDRPLQKSGRKFKCCCPFHSEKTPSCQIDPDTQLFYCFGCQTGGDVFTYVMKRDEVDFPDAFRWLANRAGIEVAESSESGPSRSYKARLREVCAETQAFYHHQLMRLKSPEADAARSYLAQRGFGGEVPKRWQLGFAPGSGALVRHLRAKGFSAKEMQDANVAVSYNGRPLSDRFFNRIIFPIFSEQGECIAFGGRQVGKGDPTKGKYVNSTETPLFHKRSVLYGLDKAKAQMAATGTAIVVEGYTDVIALHEAGVRNAVATLGTALTRHHVRALSRHAGKRIVYLFDGDEAGQRAAARALEFIDETMTPEAGKRRVDLVACTIPDDLDPADFVSQRGASALEELLEGATPLIGYGIERVIAHYDDGTSEGRAQAFTEALALLAPIKDSVLASDYAVQIAGRLHVREQDAYDQLRRLQPRRRPGAQDDEGEAASVQPAVPEATSSPAPPVAQLSQTERNRRRFEGLFLGLLARNPHIALVHVDDLGTISWHDPLHEAVADKLLELVSADPQIAASRIVSQLTQELPSAARILVGEEAGTQDAAYDARYLADELSIGDLEEAVATYRARLANPSGMSKEEYDSLFHSVASLQQALADRRAAHKAQAF